MHATREVIDVGGTLCLIHRGGGKRVSARPRTMRGSGLIKERGQIWIGTLPDVTCWDINKEGQNILEAIYKSAFP